MKLHKSFKHALDMVLHSRLRSWLTILGIVIGVAAVIAIMSLGAGLKQQINSRLGGLGADIVTVTPGFSRGGGFGGFGGGGGGFGGGGGATATSKPIVLSRTDAQVLRGIPGILVMDTEIRGSTNITYLDKTGTISVTGVDQKFWSQITTVTLSDGRMLDSADQNVVVIGGRLANSYFSKPVGINQMINIGGNAFRVVGVLNDQSNSVYMPIQMAYSVLPTKTNGNYDSIIVKVRDQNQLNETMTAMTSALGMSRHVTGKTQDFSIASNQQEQATVSSTLNTMSMFLLAIAAVSLIVGAVGVANTMFTSVLEKTKEIGIMKAIGARNKDILLIFLFNAALIGLIGGILGVLLGMVLSGFMQTLLGGTPFARGSTLVTMSSIVWALSVSVIVGIVAGIVPAYQGSKLKPVDALRYE
jgi:putative ABC transport system permease protein